MFLIIKKLQFFLENTFMRNLLFYVFLMTLIACGNNTENAANDAAAKASVTGEKAPMDKFKTNTAPKVQRKKHPNAKTMQGNKGSRPAPKSVSMADYKAKNDGWMVDLEKAYAESEKTGKPIMANFTGSDWCGWCKKLDKSVFHQPGFEKWADKNVVLLELDFPRRFKLPQEVAQQNRGLQQSLGVRGYPTIWLFDVAKDNTGKFNISGLGKTGYTKTLGEFQKTMEGFITQRGKAG